MEPTGNADAKHLMQVKAIADETRLHIIGLLASGPLCACEILATLELTQPTLSYHMKLLGESALVESRREGRWMHYSLNSIAYKELLSYLAHLSVPGNRPIATLGKGCSSSRSRTEC